MLFIICYLTPLDEIYLTFDSIFHISYQTAEKRIPVTFKYGIIEK